MLDANKVIIKLRTSIWALLSNCMLFFTRNFRAGWAFTYLISIMELILPSVSVSWGLSLLVTLRCWQLSGQNSSPLEKVWRGVCVLRCPSLAWWQGLQGLSICTHRNKILQGAYIHDKTVASFRSWDSSGSCTDCIKAFSSMQAQTKKKEKRPSFTSTIFANIGCRWLKINCKASVNHKFYAQIFAILIKKKKSLKIEYQQRFWSSTVIKDEDIIKKTRIRKFALEFRFESALFNIIYGSSDKSVWI